MLHWAAGAGAGATPVPVHQMRVAARRLRSGIAVFSRATGNAEYRLKLDLPLAAVDKAKVQASIALNDNELQLVPEAPALTQVRGALNFTEGGFSLAGVQADDLQHCGAPAVPTIRSGDGHIADGTGNGQDDSARRLDLEPAERHFDDRRICWIAHHPIC